MLRKLPGAKKNPAQIVASSGQPVLKKVQLIKLKTAGESNDTAQVTSSDEVTVHNLSQRREEIYGVIKHQKLKDLNSSEQIDIKEKQSVDDKVFIEEVYSCVSGESVNNSSHMHNIAQGPHDFISSEMYIGCETEETVEIQEEEIPATFANTAANRSQAGLESILIIPTSKRMDNVADQFVFLLCLHPWLKKNQAAVSRRVPAPTVTFVNFQQSKVTETLNRAATVIQKTPLGTVEQTVAPQKRYFLSSKPNYVVAQPLLQQPRPSLNTNKVSILLPMNQQPALRAGDSNKTSILKTAASATDSITNNSLKELPQNLASYSRTEL